MGKRVREKLALPSLIAKLSKPLFWTAKSGKPSPSKSATTIGPVMYCALIGNVGIAIGLHRLDGEIERFGLFERRELLDGLFALRFGLRAQTFGENGEAVLELQRLVGRRGHRLGCSDRSPG